MATLKNNTSTTKKNMDSKVIADATLLLDLTLQRAGYKSSEEYLIIVTIAP